MALRNPQDRFGAGATADTSPAAGAVAQDLTRLPSANHPRRPLPPSSSSSSTSNLPSPSNGISPVPFGSEVYSREELVAEFGAAFLASFIAFLLSTVISA